MESSAHSGRLGGGGDAFVPCHYFFKYVTGVGASLRMLLMAAILVLEIPGKLKIATIQDVVSLLHYFFLAWFLVR